MDSKGIKRETKKDLIKMMKLDHQYAKASNKKEKHQIALIENEYRNMILFYVQAQDYPVAYTDSKPAPQVFSMWLQFLSGNTTQMHTNLLANVHLSATDKLIGALIDTFVGFCYLAFDHISIFTVSLPLISMTTRIPLDQVRQSVRHLGNYAGYFDHSTHPEDDQ